MHTFPFNLDQFRAGHPTVTRNGRSATFVADIFEGNNLAVKVDGERGLQVYDLAGVRDDDYPESDSALLMKQEEIIPWTEDQVPRRGAYRLKTCGHETKQPEYQLHTVLPSVNPEVPYLVAFLVIDQTSYSAKVVTVSPQALLMEWEYAPYLHDRKWYPCGHKQ